MVEVVFVSIAIAPGTCTLYAMSMRSTGQTGWLVNRPPKSESLKALQTDTYRHTHTDRHIQTDTYRQTRTDRHTCSPWYRYTCEKEIKKFLKFPVARKSTERRKGQILCWRAKVVLNVHSTHFFNFVFISEEYIPSGDNQWWLSIICYIQLSWIWHQLDWQSSSLDRGTPCKQHFRNSQCQRPWLSDGRTAAHPLDRRLWGSQATGTRVHGISGDKRHPPFPAWYGSLSSAPEDNHRLILIFTLHYNQFEQHLLPIIPRVSYGGHGNQCWSIYGKA